MNRTILQVPIRQDLKISAEKEALSQGFSSLQETIRVLLTKLSKHELILRIQEPTEDISSLSSEAEERYEQAYKDIKAGKNIYRPKNKKEFFKILNS